MNLKIIYYPDGIWDGGGMLPACLKDFSDIPAWIEKYLAIIDKSRTVENSLNISKKSLQGKPHQNPGPELAELIGGLLLFRYFLADGQSGRYAADGGRGVFSIRFLDSVWTGSGKFSGTEYGLPVTLNTEMLLDKIEMFFTTYRSHTAENSSLSLWKAELSGNLDSIFCDFIAGGNEQDP